MPTLSVYVVSVTVGGRGSAIIDWQKYIYTSKCSSENIYSVTSLIQTPLGPKIIILINEVSLFQGENNMYLYKVGTQSSVLIKQGILISEVFFKRGSTVYVVAIAYFHCITVFEVL